MRRYAYLLPLDMSALGEEDSATFHRLLEDALRAATARQKWNERLPGYGMTLNLRYVDGRPVSVQLVEDEHLSELTGRVRDIGAAAGATIPEIKGQVLFEVPMYDTGQYESE